MKAIYAIRHGLSLVEVVVSTLLVGLLLTASLVSVGGAARTTFAATQTSDMMYLAQQLLEEISILAFEDPNQTPVFGMEPGESTVPASRTQVDDIDDLANWSETPPKDRTGINLPSYIGWTRSVKVIQGSAQDRTIEVTVTAPSGRSMTLKAFRSKEGGSLQPQGVNQTLVTWIGVTLQTGAGAGVTSGVSLVNHAADQ